MKITDDNILVEAEKGNLDILEHPSVDKVVNKFGATPLHYLAWKGKIEVLEHPSVDKVVNQYGETPLHSLAWQGKVPRKWIKEKYPWFKLGRRKITDEIITEILNTSYAERFILDCNWLGGCY